MKAIRFAKVLKNKHVFLLAQKYKLLLIGLMGSVTIAPYTLAQTPPTQTSPNPDPNLDSLPNSQGQRFPQSISAPQPIPSEPSILSPQPTLSPAPSPTIDPSLVKISVQKLSVIGSTILKPSDVQPIAQSVEGRSVTLEELRSAADAITQIYLNRGYITSRAVLVDQAITDGVVQIQVLEGAIEQIDIQGLERLKPAYVRSRLEFGTVSPFNKDTLEDQLRLLKTDPLFENVEASLKPGTGLGRTILTVRMKESKSLHGFIGADNYSPPSVSSERFGALLSYRNLTGIGDELSASHHRTNRGGSNTFDFSYRIPVNPMNGTVQFRIAPSKSKIVAPQFADFGIRSNTSLYEISYRQPLIRSPRQEFALSLGFTLQNGQTFLFQNTPFPFGVGPDTEGNSRTRVLKFGQDYIKRDSQGALVVRSLFNLGLDLFDATVNPDPIPDGRFFSWLGQVQRVHRLGDNHLLIAQADLQLTPSSLLPSQQFVIGGGQSLRGYRQNVRSGDNGFRFTLEDRIALQRNASGAPILQIAPFVDIGTVWNRSSNPNRLPSQTFLAGTGLGLIVEPAPRLTLRLDYALPFLKLNDRGNNAQDRGFYFSVGYNL